jgi:DNA polymerase III gamma/tau subunit
LLQDASGLISPVQTDKEALSEIAKLSDGSFRDAAKLLEEISIFAGRKNITADLVNEKFNTLGINDSILQMLDAFVKRDTKRGIEICKDLAKQGMDFKFFIEELMEKLHLLLLQKVGVEKVDVESTLELREIKKLFELLTTAYQETKSAVLSQMPLEMVVLEWGSDRGPAADESVARQSHSSDDARQGAPQSLKQPRSLNENLSQTSARRDATAFDSPQNGLSRNANNFKLLIEEVKHQNPLVAGLLRSCSAEDVKDGKLNIVASSKFHKGKLEEQKAMRILEDSAEKAFGAKIKIQISGTA